MLRWFGFKAAGAIVAAVGVVSATGVQAQEARYLASNCANCHGTEGRSAGGGGMPGLAGLSRAYFLEQMNAFRSGARQATVMHQIAKGYTDEQIAQLADFFSKQPVAGK
ncbi:MAG TPA: c-type cytochrome [Quisquiliibacterium sp.]|nr:c-type cytochrome [Quisquiliibacterium sp.]HQN14263.1 c-type cytochrome [Quisquiliibacterium sp.]